MYFLKSHSKHLNNCWLPKFKHLMSNRDINTIFLIEFPDGIFFTALVAIKKLHYDFGILELSQILTLVFKLFYNYFNYSLIFSKHRFCFPKHLFLNNQITKQIIDFKKHGHCKHFPQLVKLKCNFSKIFGKMLFCI